MWLGVPREGESGGTVSGRGGHQNHGQQPREAGGDSAMPSWGGLPASPPRPRVGNLGQGLGGSQDKSSVVRRRSAMGT